MIKCHAYAERERVLVPMSSVLLTTVLLKLPIAIVQRTHLATGQPSTDAVKVECMVAGSPRYGALFGGCGGLICLALDAQLHDVVLTDGADVDHNVPSPQCHRRQFRFETLLLACYSNTVTSCRQCMRTFTGVCLNVHHHVVFLCFWHF